MSADVNVAFEQARRAVVGCLRLACRHTPHARAGALPQPRPASLIEMEVLKSRYGIRLHVPASLSPIATANASCRVAGVFEFVTQLVQQDLADPGRDAQRASRRRPGGAAQCAPRRPP